MGGEGRGGGVQVGGVGCVLGEGRGEVAVLCGGGGEGGGGVGGRGGG